jgi:hypothetical protein
MLLNSQIVMLTSIQNQDHPCLCATQSSPVVGQRGVEQQGIALRQPVFPPLHLVRNEALQAIDPFDARVLDRPGTGARFHRDQERGKRTLGQTGRKMFYRHPRASALHSVGGLGQHQPGRWLSRFEESCDRHSEPGSQPLQGIHTGRTETPFDQTDGVGRYITHLRQSAQRKGALLPQFSNSRSNVWGSLSVHTFFLFL